MIAVTEEQRRFEMAVHRAKLSGLCLKRSKGNFNYQISYGIKNVLFKNVDQVTHWLMGWEMCKLNGDNDLSQRTS